MIFKAAISVPICKNFFPLTLVIGCYCTVFASSGERDGCLLGVFFYHCKGIKLSRVKVAEKPFKDMSLDQSDIVNAQKPENLVIYSKRSASHTNAKGYIPKRCQKE